MFRFTDSKNRLACLWRRLSELSSCAIYLTKINHQTANAGFRLLTTDENITHFNNDMQLIPINVEDSRVGGGVAFADLNSGVVANIRALPQVLEKIHLQTELF